MWKSNDFKSEDKNKYKVIKNVPSLIVLKISLWKLEDTLAIIRS